MLPNLAPPSKGHSIRASEPAISGRCPVIRYVSHFSPLALTILIYNNLDANAVPFDLSADPPNTPPDSSVPSAIWDALFPSRSVSVAAALEHFLPWSRTPSTTLHAQYARSPATHLLPSQSGGVEDIVKKLLSHQPPTTASLATLRTASTSAAASKFQSIRLATPTLLGHFPLWMEVCLNRMATVAARHARWVASKAWLETKVVQDPSAAALADTCRARLHLVDWDASIPGLSQAMLSTADLTTLLSNDWLTDEHINAAGELINKTLGEGSHIRVVNTHFLGSLDHNRQTYATWSPRTSRRLDNLIASKHVNTLLIPLHGDNHWTLLLVNIDNHSCVYVDSLNPSNITAPDHVLDLLDWWLESLLPGFGALSEEERDFEAGDQMDGHSCGIAVITTMAHIALQRQAWTQEASHKFRMEWFLLLSGAFAPPEPEVRRALYQPRAAANNVLGATD